LTEEPSAEDLLARLDRAARAAEGLIAEAARGAGQRVRGGRPPAAGWQAPEGEASPPRELEVLAGLVDSVRELVPEDLQRRLSDALRELLLAMRALIDWYLERAERGGGAGPEVEDIPIS
jgi:hypothetical protein